jgi:hypothetical protein
MSHVNAQTKTLSGLDLCLAILCGNFLNISNNVVKAVLRQLPGRGPPCTTGAPTTCAGFQALCCNLIHYKVPADVSRILTIAVPGVGRGQRFGNGVIHKVTGPIKSNTNLAGIPPGRPMPWILVMGRDR